MSDVTRILSAIDAGDPQAIDQLLPLVYDELRKLAAGHMEALALFEETLKLQKAKLGANHSDTAETIFGIACLHAKMIAETEDRGKQADLAIDWLHQAAAAGYKDVEHIKKDKDLDALRDREDFKKLIAELESKTEKK